MLELHEPSALVPRPRAAASQRFQPDSAFGWFCTGIACLACLYAVSLAGVFNTGAASPATLEWLSLWGALPMHAAACMLVSALLWRRPGSRRYRLAWALVLLFVLVNAIATYVWNEWRPRASREVFSFADLVYVTDYGILTGACAVWFLWAGGSFRRAQVWLDAVTMMAVLLLGLWSFFLAPTAGADTERSISFGAIFGYSTAIVSMMAMAGLLCLQLPGYRSGLPILLVVCGGLLDVIWEIMWMASWLTDRDFVSPFFNYGDVLCFAVICCAVALTQFETQGRAEASSSPEQRMDGFLPLLGVLVAIAVLSVSVASARRWDAWMLNALVAACAILLILRQQSARKEMRALNRELARREADARLIELVRRSADLIVVVSAAGRITFASPAAETLLGRDPAQLHGTEAVALFDAAQRPALAELLARATRVMTPIGAEIRVQSAAGLLRVYKLSAINRFANPLIQGIVLTVTDVTEQRQLEREVLDVAARERVHLSGEIHDGLGQELVGIGMLLQGAASSRQTDSAVLKQQLQELVGQINQVVGSARNLARGLSPLGVARGSLGAALRRLVPESQSPVRIMLDIDPAFDERVIEDFRADHLYRIAQEAVSNAIRHSGGSLIRISLRRVPAAVSLGIIDDGRGFDAPPAGYPGLGLRMMEYRARVMGGRLRLEHASGAGTRIEVVVPVSAGGGPV